MCSLSRWSKSQPVLLLSLFVILAANLAPRVAASALTNAGYIVFSAVRLEENDSATLAESSSVVRAQQFWEESLRLAPDHPSAWRGLGLASMAVGQYSRAFNAWQQGGLGVPDLINLGEMARRNGNNAEALTWYKQAVKLAPELADPWYHIGLAYMGKEEWESALDAFQRGTEHIDRGTIGASSFYYRIGWLVDRRLDPPDRNQAQVAYETALSLDDFSFSQEQAQAHFYLGEIYQQAGRVREALREYEWVVARQPEHYWAHAGAGRLYWQVERDVERAEATLLMAISLRPEVKWAYRNLAQVYQEMGRAVEAIAMYERVLSLDSQDRLALEQLKELIPPERE